MKAETVDKTAQNWLKEAQKGYIRIGILILLNKKPSHGYELMKEFKNRSKGLYKPTPGGVYPILRDLEQSGYIKGQWQAQKKRRFKVYTVTSSGEAILKRAITKQTEISNNIYNLFQEFAKDVLNVEMAKTPLSNMPSMFSTFLEDKEENLQDLEAQRKQIKETIVTMRHRLKAIGEEISQLKKQGTPSPREE